MEEEEEINRRRKMSVRKWRQEVLENIMDLY